MEENKVIENEATEAVADETKKESGLVRFVKKNWKKLVAVGVTAGAYLVGREMGKRSAGCDCDCCSDIIETDFSEVDTNE